MSDPESHVALAVVLPYLFQALKANPHFKWMTYSTQTANRVITAITAGLVGIGVHFVFNSGTLTVTGLTVANIGHGLYGAMVQWALQHASYKLIVAPPLPGEIQATKRAAPVEEQVAMQKVGAPPLEPPK